jgi:cobalt/nickel transport system permease protein
MSSEPISTGQHGPAAGSTGAQRLDARIKIVAALLFVLWVVLTPLRLWPCYLVQLAIVLSVYLWARLPLRLLATRLAVVLPFLLLIAAAVPLSRGFSAGWDIAAQIVIRSSLALSAMIVLAATTAFPSFISALSWFRVPRVFVSILTFMHRYLHVLAEEAMRMHRAKQSRTCRPSLWTDTRIMANCVGILFVRAFERAERVYAAMLARGWQGKFPD